MKKYLSILCMLAIVLSGCNKVTGEGPVITETRTIDAVFGVRLEGEGAVEIVQGNAQSITISGYENLLSIYETEVVNGVLILHFKSGYFNIHNNNIKVTVVMPIITYLKNNGSGTISVKNFQSGSVFSGAINGSGNVYLEGSSFTRMDLSINGSGDIRAATTVTTEANASIHGSGSIDISCSAKLTGYIAGSGNINYWGNPSVDVSVTGSGRARKQ